MLTKEQIKILNNRVKGKWSLDRKTGLVNVNGDFNSNSNRERYERKWKNLQGIRFGYVTGSFYCSNNNLTSLEGAPTKVGGCFKCYHNNLTSLEGAPIEVGGWFDCSDNKLTSLEGAPTEVGGLFDCSDNNLTSLEGAPTKVGGSFYCYSNKLTSLEGAPTKVGGSFYCYYNNLTSLEGAPTKVGGWFKCSHNKLTSLEGMPQRVGEFTSDFLEIQRSVVFNQKNLINFYSGKIDSNVTISNYEKTRSLIFPLLKKETLDKYIFIDF